MSLLSQFSSGGVTKNVITVEIFGVGGGGGSGAPNGPGGIQGGGAGGGGAVLHQRIEVIPGTAYTIIIGAGGAAGIGSTAISASRGSIGNNTYFGSTLIGGGGGGGGASVIEPVSSVGGFGSSGGFSASPDATVSNAPAVVSTACFASNTSYSQFFSYFANPAPGADISIKEINRSGGGGGASGIYKRNNLGEVITTVAMDGIPASLIGISTIAVGGGGNGHYPTPTPAPSKVIVGGGGDINQNGTANTGGGGGSPSTSPTPGGSGGSGVLFVRYPTAYAAATVSGNTPAPSQPGYYVYRWNSGPGSITFN